MSDDRWSQAWLSGIEDAGLNASAPPQQRWMDGWLLRFSPGKAKRARCVNAVAAGHLPWADKLRRANAFYAERGLAMIVRTTPFTQPPELDAELASAGFSAIDRTQVMICMELAAGGASAAPAPKDWRCESPGTADFADAAGALRGSSTEQRAAHAERLLHAPVPSERLVIRRTSDAVVLACGQATLEGDAVGLYDIYTREDARGTGLASWMCERLLSSAAKHGARTGYLQVEANNHAARRIYARLGFADAYTYHYRQQA